MVAGGRAWCTAVYTCTVCLVYTLLRPGVVYTLLLKVSTLNLFLTPQMSAVHGKSFIKTLLGISRQNCSFWYLFWILLQCWALFLGQEIKSGMWRGILISLKIPEARYCKTIENSWYINQAYMNTLIIKAKMNTGHGQVIINTQHSQAFMNTG